MNDQREMKIGMQTEMGIKRYGTYFWEMCAVVVLCVAAFLVMAYDAGANSASGKQESLPLFIGLCAAAFTCVSNRLRGTRPMLLPIALGILVAGMVIRFMLLDGISNDYQAFLTRWVKQFREQGLDGFKNSITDYNVLYLYYLYLIAKLPVGDLALIKLLSVAGDVVMALTGARLAARMAGQNESKRGILYVAGLGAFWLLPTFWLNSAWWAQCDSLYGALCLLALLMVLENKPALSVIAASLAFAFKLQTIFFLPIYVVYLIARKVHIKHALIFPAVIVGVTLPAMLFGMPASRAFGVYYQQTAQYSDYLNLNSSSAFGLLPDGFPHDPIFAIGIVMAALFMLALWVVAFYRPLALNEERLIYMTYLMSFGIPWLLPGMHDRYFYLAEMFALLIVLRWPKRWPAVLLTCIGSYAGYHAYIFRRYLVIAQFRMGVPSLLMGIGLILAVTFFVMDCYEKTAEEQRLKQNVLATRKGHPNTKN